MNRKLTDEELSMVCEVIASRMGLHFPIERWTMLNRNLALASTEFGFQDMSGFIQWLLSATLNKDQIEVLASYLTISETYFWREPKVFRAFTDYILPELIRSKKKGEKSIRIWSAGCSTGEEPYSIAMALHKTINKFEDWDVSILATDINPRAIRKAVSGIYGTWSFRNSPSWLKSTYFHLRGDRKYEIIPEIKKMVTFSCLSLVEMSAISNASTMNIIFCRNVLMYFTPDWINKIAESFFQTLTDDGWFVVSSCELSSQVFPQFKSVNFPGAVIYRKSRNGSVISHDINSLSSSTFSDPAKSPLHLDLPITFSPILPLTPSLHNPVTPSPVLPFAVSPIQQPHATPEESYTTKIFTIRLLANQGFLSEALALCNEAIRSEKLATGYYFVCASILQEMDKISEAIDSLKKAIYIDPDYVMGHFTLGNLFIKQGNNKNAERYFNNVLNLLNKYSDDYILPESEGLSVQYIREIIRTNMQTQQTK